MAAWAVKGGLSLVIMILVALQSQIPTCESRRYQSTGIAGPFKIVIKRIEQCPPEIRGKSQIDFFIRETRESILVKDPTYTGNISMPFTMDNKLSGYGALASWNSVAGWKNNALVFKYKGICRAMDMFLPNIWRSFLMTQYGEILSCPFLPLIARFDNFSLSWKDLPFKQFFYNRWRADLQMIHENGDVAACIRGFGDTVPV